MRGLAGSNSAGSSRQRINRSSSLSLAEGLQHGYADRRRADGVFEYFGEGQVGDMQLSGGNKAIAEHSAKRNQSDRA